MSRRLGIGLALALLAVGPLELAASLFFAWRTPKDADWDAARARVLEVAKDTDGVIVAPRWAEPQARRAFGDVAFPLELVARADESRLRRVTLVSSGGATLPELAHFRVVRDEPLGHGLSLRILEHPSPATVTVDFVRRVAEGAAEVSLRFADVTSPCPFSTHAPVVAPGLFGHPTLPPVRFRCGARPYLGVGVTVHEDERYLPRRCIWSHPPEGGSTRITFRDVPLGAVIRGHVSIHWTLERERRGAPVRLGVTVDGERLGTEIHEDGEGWKLFSMPTGAHGGRTAAEVVFELDSDSANERHVCWEADSR